MIIIIALAVAADITVDWYQGVYTPFLVFRHGDTLIFNTNGANGTYNVLREHPVVLTKAALIAPDHIENPNVTEQQYAIDDKTEIEVDIFPGGNFDLEMGQKGNDTHYKFGLIDFKVGELYIDVFVYVDADWSTSPSLLPSALPSTLPSVSPSLYFPTSLANSTVASSATVGSFTTATSKPTSSSNDDGLSPLLIAGIAVGGVVVLGFGVYKVWFSSKGAQASFEVWFT